MSKVIFLICNGIYARMRISVKCYLSTISDFFVELLQNVSKNLTYELNNGKQINIKSWVFKVICWVISPTSWVKVTGVVWKIYWWHYFGFSFHYWTPLSIVKFIETFCKEKELKWERITDWKRKLLLRSSFLHRWPVVRKAFK